MRLVLVNENYNLDFHEAEIVDIPFGSEISAESNMPLPDACAYLLVLIDNSPEITVKPLLINWDGDRGSFVLSFEDPAEEPVYARIEMRP